ncbi:pyridoxamine 5'-phosphate oxidase family protein [Jatrophihabitans endophyticus]|uniref:pyridoxamine 5'-phosphate oxidase family protein n=1 Tax=Jatrophihabitans endophyticus TaxID=1206085 RepID=UPI001A087319|nr:pyridoxamine 5'-phosphate oxidase family protein [Jatrophihabitans endophyticus]MBE7188371.1 pyridoxamine 5'-phosphate oxidase family protein [Jatrophihabitans endophyticus]
MTQASPPTEPTRTRITRLREKERTDRAELDALLDSARVGHFAIADAERGPVVLPSAIARDGDRVLTHGSTGSRWLRALAGGAPTSLAVTTVHGLVVARSAFESSMHYRSAVLFGTCTRLTGDEAAVALDVITDALIPGRVGELRRPTRRELEATLVLALPIDEWSLKVSDGWPDDVEDDLPGPAWAGVVPLHETVGEPRPAPDLRAGIDVPASVHGLRNRPQAPDAPGAP